MKIHILTLFPEMFEGPFGYSIIKRAQTKKIVEIFVHNLRDWATGTYLAVDDKPYGGGAGMVMRVDIIDKAIEDIKKNLEGQTTKIVLLDAGGEIFTHKKAKNFSEIENLIFICGHYEGVDHRVHEHIADEVISVGNYVLSGGELPAMTICDAVIRLIPGVLGNSDSLLEESHTKDETEYPQYTRPENYKDWTVPEVLLSGNHKQIIDWRKSKQEKSH